jgi:ketosteroid isomerase-like protein
MRVPQPPVAAVLRFIVCINCGDVDGLAELMTDDHELVVFAERPLKGKSTNIDAWHGYASAFPNYVIYPDRLSEYATGRVAVSGHTTGSHLGLQDDEERLLTLIWLAEVQDGRLRYWHLTENNTANRHRYGLNVSM